jgi:hypothetical protein
MPLMLEIVNAHPRDKRIRFDEGPHLYYIDGKKVDISVTTWIHSHFGHFNPEKVWKENIEPKLMDPNCDPSYKYYGMTKEQVLESWRKNGADASSRGTKMHLNIEHYWNGLDVVNDSVEYEYFKKFVADYPYLKSYRTEWVVYSEVLRISGSIDMVFLAPSSDGSGEEALEIYDWKRTKEFDRFGGEGRFRKFAKTACISHIPDSNYWHYTIQLNLYKFILEKEYGKKIQRLVLVRMHPESESYDRVEVPVLEDEMVDLIQFRRKQIGLEPDPTLVKTGKRVHVPKPEDEFEERFDQCMF